MMADIFNYYIDLSKFLAHIAFGLPWLAFQCAISFLFVRFILMPVCKNRFGKAMLESGSGLVIGLMTFTVSIPTLLMTVIAFFYVVSQLTGLNVMS